MSLIEIKDLHATVDGKEILSGLSLTINPGEVHAIMGPNGTGKSTLSNIITGRDGYEVTSGSITYKGEDLLEQEADERARAGIYLAFQYPVELPGVAYMTFLKHALNAKRRDAGLEDVDAMEFLKLVKSKAAELEIDYEMLKRPVNVGFSGGEKKRAEILQMALLEPSLAVMDETDSGLDIDALKVVSNGVNAMRDGERGFLLITHYQRLLNYIEPDVVHVMAGGKIVKTGDKTLALELEESGYAEFLEPAA